MSTQGGYKASILGLKLSYDLFSVSLMNALPHIEIDWSRDA